MHRCTENGKDTFYLSGFAGIAHKSDEPGPHAVILSRHHPDRTVVVAYYYLGTMLAQPSWGFGPIGG